jgi:hypothetical protein
METVISFAPCYDLYHEMGARPGFSFVPTVRFRVEGCMDGSWADSTLCTLCASCDQPGVLEMQQPTLRIRGQGAGNSKPVSFRTTDRATIWLPLRVPSHGIRICSRRLKRRAFILQRRASERRVREARCSWSASRAAGRRARNLHSRLRSS